MLFFFFVLVCDVFQCNIYNVTLRIMTDYSLALLLSIFHIKTNDVLAFYSVLKDCTETQTLYISMLVSKICTIKLFTFFSFQLFFDIYLLS